VEAGNGKICQVDDAGEGCKWDRRVRHQQVGPLTGDVRRSWSNPGGPSCVNVYLFMMQGHFVVALERRFMVF
jgi:hypothetical protein